MTLWPFSLQPMMLPDSIIGSQSNLSTSACRSLLTCASYSIGRRFSSWYPNFSCSVPILRREWVHRVVVVSVRYAGEGGVGTHRFLRPRGDKKGLESESDGGMTERVRAHLHSDLGLQPDAM